MGRPSTPHTPEKSASSVLRCRVWWPVPGFLHIWTGDAVQIERTKVWLQHTAAAPLFPIIMGWGDVVGDRRRRVRAPVSRATEQSGATDGALTLILVCTAPSSLHPKPRGPKHGREQIKTKERRERRTERKERNKERERGGRREKREERAKLATPNF